MTLKPIPTPPPPDQTSLSALRSSKIANLISALALATAAGSTVFSCEQASAARDANDQLRATQAQNVFFDAPVVGADGQIRILLENRNHAPISNVSYTYRVAGAQAGPLVSVGTIPGCSALQVTPTTADAQASGFMPVAVFFTDPSGEDWQRTNGGPLEKVSAPTLSDNTQSGVHVTAVANC